MKALVFVESEAKARTMADQSGLEMEGVVLQESPVFAKHDPAIPDLHLGEVGFDFSPRSSDGTFLQKLDEHAARDIIVAFDNDQRGDSWSWMIHGYLASSDQQGRGCRRLRIHGLKKELISEELAGSRGIPFAAGAAYYIRSQFNRCLGGHLKRLIGTASGPENLPLDYTSLSLLFLLADRHTLAAPGASRAGFQLQSKLSSGNGNLVVTMKEGGAAAADGLVSDSTQVKNILAELAEQSFVLETVQRKAAKVDPPEPLDLSQLLHEGHRLLGMSPRQVWFSLMQLYHGVAIDGIWAGLITDPYGKEGEKNDDLLLGIRKYVGDTYGGDEVCEGKCGARAILPLNPALPGESLPKELGEKAVQLYDLIRSRAIMSQMLSVEGDEIEAEVRAGTFLFSGRGVEVKKSGFLKEMNDNDDFLNIFPDQLQEGQKEDVVELSPRAVSNSAANPYTLPILLEELQDFSIVHSSTLAAVLQKLIDGNYFRVLSDGTLLCLGNTTKVADTINRVFPKMQGINLSAYFEQTVLEVISGRKDIDFALKQFDQNFQIQGVSLLRKEAPSLVIPREKRSKNIIKSPIEEDAGSSAELPVVNQPADLSESSDQTPDFASSQHEDDAEEAVIPAIEEGVGEEESLPEIAEEESGYDGVETAAELYAEESEDVPVVEEREEHEPDISVSPDLKAGEDDLPEEPPETHPPELSVESDIVVDEKVQALSEALNRDDKKSSGPQEGRADVPCPLCGNDHLMVNRTSSDKIYYECPVSNCEFIAWSRPHGISCPKCRSPYLVEKKGAEAQILHCPKAGCRYEQPVSSGASGGAAGEKKKVLVKRKKGSSGSGAKTRKVVVRRKR